MHHASSPTPDLSGDELAVWHAINQRQGRERAIQAKEVAAQVELPERQVRDIVRHLIVDHAFPIGSTTKPPYGYFLPATAEEYEQAVRQIRHRIMSLVRRENGMVRNTPQDVLGQLLLADWQGDTIQIGPLTVTR